MQCKDSVGLAWLLAGATFLGAACLRGQTPASSDTPLASSVGTGNAAAILTPKPAATPCINGPKIFGVRPGSPFLYSIPATGERPMTFSADALPEGLQLDAATGRITGEQYTHISLWCLLSSPLLIGCDLEKMDDFTLGLLTNDEVLEIDQDTLCKSATQIAGQGDLKVYAKPLDDGSWAVGLFNTGKESAAVTIHWADLKLTGEQRVRDLWRQRDIGTVADKFESNVSSHGVMLVRLYPVH